MQCNICSHILLRYLRNHQTYWFCRHCRTELPDEIVQRRRSSSKRCLKPVLPQGNFKHSSQKEISARILCAYNNLNSEIRVVRITNLPGQHFERTVMPYQQLIFETVPEALLEVYGGGPMGCIIEDRIVCDRLAISIIKESHNIQDETWAIAASKE